MSMNPSHIAAVQRLIAAHGHIVVNSSANGYDFAYTVGITNLGHPEMIITGLPVRQSTMVLYAAVPIVLADRHATLGSTYELANDSAILPTFNVQLAPVSDQQRLAHMRIALAIYGPDHVTARQLLFADFNRRMPTHPGYDHATLPQPLLSR